MKREVDAVAGCELLLSAEPQPENILFLPR
jgi:hypothetical protein